jgi:cytochrome c biogenesis protein CcmG, thiol:disulfide interchange protein DsbE
MKTTRRFTLDNALLVAQLAGLVALVWTATGVVQERLIAVGDKAPDFSVTTDDGRTISRNNFGGQLLVVNFWATWCPPCIFEMPSLSEFARSLQPHGVVVLAVSIDEENRSYRDFLERLQPPFLTTRAGGSDLASEFGTVKVPETYIIDGTGRVLRKYVDARNWMEPAILSDIETLLGN